MRAIHQAITGLLTVVFWTIGSAATEAQEYWGAYAWANWDSSAFGLSWNYQTPHEAARRALKECQSRTTELCDMIEVFSSSAVHDSTLLSQSLRSTFPSNESNYVTNARCVLVVAYDFGGEYADLYTFFGDTEGEVESEFYSYDTFDDYSPVFDVVCNGY